jgi:hypothetical protein
VKVILLDFPSDPFAIIFRAYVPRAALEDTWIVTLLVTPDGESVIGLDDHVAVIPGVRPRTENVTLWEPPFIVAASVVEEPRVTLPDVGFSDNATVATNFANIDPGPLIVAVVELLEAELKDIVLGEPEDHPEKA